MYNALSHYDENPILIIIFSALCLLFILIIGDDQIVVYKDSVSQTTNSLMSFIFKSKGRTYKLDTIKTAYLEPNIKLDFAEIGIIALLAMILPRNTSNSNATRPIYFELKNGETVKFDTNLENKKMKHIVEMINNLIK